MNINHPSVFEIAFYQNRHQAFQSIEDQLKELESKYYAIPVVYTDEKGGKMRISGGSVENRVIEKIEVERALVKLRDRIDRRVQRFESAFLQLSEEAQDLIDYVFFYDGSLSQQQRSRLLGFSSMKEYKRAAMRALWELYFLLVFEKVRIKQERDVLI